MANSPLSDIVPQLRKAVLLRDGAGMTDGQLLESFVAQGDQAAFAALVRRHGPMVWGVCRRLLLNHHDAEDAFQAAFLVLARRAASVRPREAVGGWLHGVAYRTALKARTVAARRRARERQVKEMPEPPAEDKGLWREVQPILDRELSRLPDDLRAALVLCDVEERTRKEAARLLGLPEGTLSGRLARARRILARRLSRLGLPLSGGVLAGLLAANAAPAGVPFSLFLSPFKTASLIAAGPAATGALPPRVAALAEGVVQAMLRTKLKTALAGLLVIASLWGVGILISHAQEANKSAARQSAAAGTPAARSEPRLLENFLLTLDKQMWNAAATGDWEVYQALLADDYVGFSSRYGRDDKAACVAAVKRRRYSDRKVRDVEFRRVGKDAAVLTYVYDCKVTEGAVTEEYRNHRASFVWAQRDRVWVLVFSQDTTLAEPEGDREGKQQEHFRRHLEKAYKVFP